MGKKTSQKPSHIKDLLLLFAIPGAILLFVAGLIYIPRLAAHPTYDFLYSTCSSYNCSIIYRVNDAGVIELSQQTKKSTSRYKLPRENVDIYYHTTAKDSNLKISQQEAEQYKLDRSSRSPDGYVLELSRPNSGGFLFGSSQGKSQWKLVNGFANQPISITSNNGYYSDGNIKFIGWVKK